MVTVGTSLLSTIALRELPNKTYSIFEEAGMFISCFLANFVLG